MGKITNSQEFLEYLKAGARELGLDDSNITELVEEPTDSSATMTYGVVMNPRLPQRKDEAPQG